jgi:hypothetical protein
VGRSDSGDPGVRRDTRCRSDVDSLGRSFSIGHSRNVGLGGFCLDLDGIN